LFGFRQDFADVVDRSLDSILVRFFLSFHHDDDVDDSVGCRQVEQHELLSLWCCEDRAEERILFNSREAESASSFQTNSSDLFRNL